MSGWSLIRWFASKVGKSLIGKLQKEMEFRASGLRNWQTCMNERFSSEYDFESKSTIASKWFAWANSFMPKRQKGNAVDNYRPISCLLLMWKVLTGITSEHSYIFLEEKILPEELKDCKRNSTGTKDQVLLDKAVLTDCKRRSTNLAMAWIDCQKAYMIPQS